MGGKRFHILTVFGTRPEAIKLAPVVHELLGHKKQFQVSVCITAQHRHILDQVIHWFRIPVHHDLNVMRPHQELCGLSVRILERFHVVLTELRPDMILVQGDTTTSAMASLAAFYHRVPVGHVEAGLRTLDRFAPFPEEINRRLTSHLADYHFAPTRWARANLLKEGIPPKRVLVTGNTVIDAFLETHARVRRHPPAIPELKGVDLDSGKLIVVTAHRRESFGRGITAICAALKRLALEREDVRIVYPVHPNPNVQGPVRETLAGITRIHLIDPLEYPSSCGS